MKKRYGIYSRETYALFLLRCIRLLRDGGRLVFIVPDTFLSLRSHRDLRGVLLNEATVKEIVLMPSNFFPGVSFGYSNLTILTLEKRPSKESDRFRVVRVNDQVESLQAIDADITRGVSAYSADLGEVIESDDFSFLVGANGRRKELLNFSPVTLGEIAQCVTGFYSGDNKRWLAARHPRVRGAANYQHARAETIEDGDIHRAELIKGLPGPRKFVPIVKGRSAAFEPNLDWLVQWDQAAVSHYQSDSRARFQNSDFYFTQGIGIPMVRSKRLRAFPLNRNLFDQSVVGIFPQDPRQFNLILAFLNSSACSELVSLVNHTTNNSANYMKRVPVPTEPDFVIESDRIVGALHAGEISRDEALAEVDRLFEPCLVNARGLDVQLQRAAS